jgi:hypothetical protein
MLASGLGRCCRRERSWNNALEPASIVARKMVEVDLQDVAKQRAVAIEGFNTCLYFNLIIRSSLLVFSPFPSEESSLEYTLHVEQRERSHTITRFSVCLKLIT